MSSKTDDRSYIENFRPRTQLKISRKECHLRAPKDGIPIHVKNCWKINKVNAPRPPRSKVDI